MPYTKRTWLNDQRTGNLHPDAIEWLNNIENGVDTVANGGSRPVLGGKAIFVGDSVTQQTGIEYGISGATTTTLYNNWPTYAELLSAGKLWHVRNLAVSGQTSTQQLASFAANATGYGASLCLICVGVNDIGAVSVSSAALKAAALVTYQANIRALVAAAYSLGMTPVLCTIPPNNDINRHAMIPAWNAWLKRYAAASGIHIVDFYATLVDTTNGNYLAAYNSGDGTHPSVAGAAAMGQATATALSSLLGTATAPIALDNTDPDNLLVDALFLGALTGGIAASWGIYLGGATPAGATCSVITDANVPGKMQQVAAAATVANTNISQSVTGLTQGNRLAFSGVVTSDGGTEAAVAVLFGDGTTVKPVDITRAVTRGRFYVEFANPSNRFDILLQTVAGTGTVSFGQITVYDLTALGIV